MSQIYITDSKAKLNIESGQLKINYADGMVHTIPFESIDGITVFGNAQLSTQCLGACLKAGIQVQYFSSSGNYFGKLSSTIHVNTSRQKAQVFAACDEQFALNLAKIILSAKINNQIVLLRRYERNHNILDNEIETIKQLNKKIKQVNTLNEAIGYEGSAAKEYFKGISKLVPKKGFNFNGRNRRPPRDPVNSMLSLGYSILINEMYAAIEGRGLSPYFGFIHQDKEKHPTLASDLIEEWRAVIVDSTVLSLISKNEISPDDFYKNEETGAVFLNRNAMRVFLKSFEEKIRSSSKYLSYIDYPISYRRAFDMQVLQLCKAIENKNPSDYSPFMLR
ncbi:MAG: CRISPR-associated endonuclease Cas1 [Christensenellaceae bacterium]|nr:CRISPR-associated endonuclease Cas1 [Christensenellaceae bacterium]